VFVFVLVGSARLIERGVGKALPETERLGISGFLAAAILTGILYAGGGVQRWAERLQLERGEARAHHIADTCSRLAAPRLTGESPPELVTAVYMPTLEGDLARALTNPKQYIPRFAEEMRVEVRSASAGIVDYLIRSGKTNIYAGRGASRAELSIDVDARLESFDLQGSLPKGAKLVRNTRVTIENRLTGKTIAQQDLPRLQFGKKSQPTTCSPLPQGVEPSVSNMTLRLLNQALET
jgi:hypothetical protein